MSENVFPEKEFRAKGIQASIWKNEKERNGQTYVQYSVKIQKTYKKSDGEYARTDYFYEDDLANLAMVARKAHEFLTLKERNPGE